MRYVGLILLLLFYRNANAQSFRTLSQTKASVRKSFEAAKLEAQRDNPNACISILLKCLEKDSLLIDAWILLGNAYHDIGSYKKALDAFFKLSSIHPAYDAGVHYAFGLTAYKYGDYALAVEKLTLYVASGKMKGLALEQTKKLLDNALFAQKAAQHPVPFSPVPLNPVINTEAPEYLPSFSADDKTLLFTRVVNGQEDLYYTQKDNETNDWQKPTPLSSLNTPFNEGAHTLSADGSTLIFTQCENNKGLGSCDLYISYKKGEQWTAPKNMGAPICTGYWESMPSIAPLGDKLFFSSRRPGGYGGSDIWMSRRIHPEKWTTPENVGPTINTSGDDQAPFIHTDGKSLYFMSNGHRGMGGFDLYLSRWNNNDTWGVPINLGFPINTIADEGALCINRTGETAYFSSSRKDSAEKGMTSKTNVDIFSFPLYEAIRPVPVTYVTGKIVANDNNEPLPAQLEINVTNTDSIIFKSALDTSGRFFICLPSGQDYSFSAICSGYTLYSQHFTLSTPQSALHPYYLDIRLQKVNVQNSERKIEILEEVGEAIILKNVFFETNATTLSSDSQYELSKLAKWLFENETTFIQINGHTDNIGSEASNQFLSTARAKAVYDYLINKGIAPKRLRYKGYGASRPIADNATESGRRENRRTEFIMLK
jgi:outer membrane protein OmpA-like peptidoglycan-associated protein